MPATALMLPGADSLSICISLSWIEYGTCVFLTSGLLVGPLMKMKPLAIAAYACIFHGKLMEIIWAHLK